MNNSLNGHKIAILIANGFEEDQFANTQRELIKTGAAVTVVSSENGLANSWNGKAWGHYFTVDTHISNFLAADYDMLVLIGGERSIAKLTQNPHTKRVINSFSNGHRPIATMAEGAELLAHADRAEGFEFSITENSAETMQEANAEISDEAICISDFIISTHGIDTIEAFIPEMVSFFKSQMETEETLEEELQAA